MNKIFLLCFLILCFNLHAQDPDSAKMRIDSVQVEITKLELTQDSIKAADTIRYWQRGGSIAVNITQSSFTNWAAGGENSFAATGLFNVFANYKKEHWVWDNSLDLGYGINKSGSNSLRKNEDKIDLNSKVGRYAFKDYWFYSAMINFKSQFANGYNYPDDSTIVSHFMAPAFIMTSLGLDYKSKDKSLSLFLSPLTGKTTIVNNQALADAGAFGVNPAVTDTIDGVFTVTTPGQKVRQEIGGYFKLTYKKDIMQNVNLTSKLELFSNYFLNPQNIDVLWENIITMKVNRFITASITTNLIYDHDIPVPVERTENGVTTPGFGPRLQFKEVLAIGISYKFF